MDDSVWTSEVQNIDSNMDKEGHDYEVLFENKVSINKWIRDHVYFTLTKNLSSFCHILRPYVRLILKIAG